MPKFATVAAALIFLGSALACGEGDEPEIRGPYVERNGPAAEEGRDVQVTPAPDRIEGDLDGDGVLSEEERASMDENP